MTLEEFIHEFRQYRKESVIERLYESINRRCTNCKYFNMEQGSQPDGLLWEKIECENGIWRDGDIEYEQVCCNEWEMKK